MNPVIEQMLSIWRSMPLIRKIILGAVVALTIIGFSSLFFMVNKTEFGILYTNLSEEDASQIVDRLKGMRVPYELQGGGSGIRVPADAIHETRLSLAGEGLPKGGGVGFEVFDKSDFGTTEFVQKLNLQRALQGELARTIRQFHEVMDARVMVVMPKDSVFVEETRPPSASVLLRLQQGADLPQSKVDAVVHLVASAIQDMTPELVTVVDTRGRVLYRGRSDEEKLAELESTRVRNQVQYKSIRERELSQRIETLLERVVGKDRAIVRVTAEMDFSREEVSEEIFDPNETEAIFVRSRKNLNEETERLRGPLGAISSVNPVVPPGTEGGPLETMERGSKQDDVVNYELSKRVRSTEKPFAVLSRLSVAAVIDGRYEWQRDEGGTMTRRYVQRTPEEMAQFTEVVKNAMGFSEARGDQVVVESFAFNPDEEPVMDEDPLTGLARLRKDYGRIAANLILLLMLFLLVLRPIHKTVKEIREGAEPPALPDEPGTLVNITDEEGEEELPLEEQAVKLAQTDFDRSANILKGWLRDE
ncbi:flagellar basal-body MS-ring/collar protein FliF [Desulfobotulus sp. H1]|uniref:Flagellar M-ring protein n=1 Tax=Desulfobotulus pelophilus TaxID=2823377 RepID=A0ABT3N8Q0_9BACT|nr:flagellar basal-body MS-ring/collar protein FliF [Desulfobotulus pelophilus]MCW7753823.1 flagellar basal-body MS-ring/collar protein FliF [Desulfobotulus pelophilus]